MTPAEQDDTVLAIIMSEEVLTDEQYGQGDHLLLLDNRDMWRSHRQGFIWDERSQRWIWPNSDASLVGFGPEF